MRIDLAVAVCVKGYRVQQGHGHGLSFAAAEVRGRALVAHRDGLEIARSRRDGHAGRSGLLYQSRRYDLHLRGRGRDHDRDGLTRLDVRGEVQSNLRVEVRLSTGERGRKKEGANVRKRHLYNAKSANASLKMRMRALATKPLTVLGPRGMRSGSPAAQLGSGQ